MSRHDKTYDRIIALAYFHRYGLSLFPLLMVLIADKINGEIGAKIFAFAWTGGFISYAVWTLVGYRRRWRHIFCSFQNAHRERMTPYNTAWGRIKKSEIYGTVCGSVILGLLFLLCLIAFL